MPKGNLYMVFFISALSLVCATVLTFAYSKWNPLYEINKQNEQRVNIMLSFGIEVDKSLDPGEIEQLYLDNIGEESYREHTVFEYMVGGQIEAVGFEMHTDGLWAPIKGFVAMDPLLERITGFAILEQEETPGLGAEIVLPGFTGQFIGKRLFDEHGKRLLFVRKAGMAKEGEVDGITGATLTVESVDRGVEAVASQIYEYKTGASGRHGG